MSRPAPGDRWWIDLALVVVLVGVADAALLLSGVPRFLEWIVAVPFLLVLPGYALVSALLPESPRAAGDGAAPGPGWPVRIGLSLALSVLTVGVSGVLLSRVWAIRLRPAVLAVSLATVGGAVVAERRRRNLPRSRRAAPLRRGLGGRLRPSIGSSLQAGALVLALLALVGAAAFAGATPADQQPYSEFSVLAEGDGGELVASALPETFVAGQGRDLHLAVENHEHRPVSYDVIVLADPGGLSASRELVARFRIDVGPGERRVVERTVAPKTAANDTRLLFLLYEDGVPADPGRGSADAVLRLWVDVVGGTA